MLKVDLQYNGIIPFNKTIYIEELSGKVNNASIYPYKTRHLLKNTVRHYSVNRFGSTRVIIMSDNEQTRFYFFTSHDIYTYLSNKPSRDNANAWINLFVSLLESNNPRHRQLYNSLSDLILTAMSKVMLGKESLLVIHRDDLDMILCRVNFVDGKVCSMTLDKDEQPTLLLRHPLNEFKKYLKIKNERIENGYL